MSEPSGAAEAEQPSEGAGALDALTNRYQAQTTFYKVMAGAAVFFALAIGALAGYGVYLNRHIDQRTSSINDTVNRVTNPKTEAQQVNGFLLLENTLAQEACNAHARQLALVNPSVSATTLMQPCSAINISTPQQPPATTAPARRR